MSTATKLKADASAVTNHQELNHDVLLTLFMPMSPMHIIKSVSLVSKHWRNVALSDPLWRKFMNITYKEIAKEITREESESWYDTYCKATKSIPVPQFIENDIDCLNIKFVYQAMRLSEPVSKSDDFFPDRSAPRVIEGLILKCKVVNDSGIPLERIHLMAVVTALACGQEENVTLENIVKITYPSKEESTCTLQSALYALAMDQLPCLVKQQTEETIDKTKIGISPFIYTEGALAGCPFVYPEQAFTAGVHLPLEPPFQFFKSLFETEDLEENDIHAMYYSSSITVREIHESVWLEDHSSFCPAYFDAGCRRYFKTYISSYLCTKRGEIIVMAAKRHAYY